MNDEFSLPEVRPGLKPLSPRVKAAVLSKVREHEQTRSKALAGLVILFLIAAVVYFARWHFTERSAVPRRSEQIAAPPKAKPAPVPVPAPVAPQFPPRTDTMRTEFVKDPINPQDTPPPEGKYRDHAQDGTVTIKPWPNRY